MSNLVEQLNETVKIIRQYFDKKPDVGVVLGSGLGNFLEELEVLCEITYEDIPHFPVSTVEGHKGKLIFGELQGKIIMCLSGRFHYYEGYSAEEVTFPIRLMKLLGVKVLLLSNAAGGMNKDFRVGDLMIINDHISLFTVNPLIGVNHKSLGPRFTDMSEPYDKVLIEKAKTIAASLQQKVFEGVYCAVTGPTYETKAEYKLLHTLGCDAVGMSTVQECIIARHMGLPVFAMSVITDIGVWDYGKTITHEEVLKAAAAAEPKMTNIFKGLIASI